MFVVYSEKKKNDKMVTFETFKEQFCISYCFETYCNSSIFSNFLEQFENRLSTFHVILRIVNTHLYQAFRRKQTRLARKSVAPLHIMRLGMQL